MKHDINIISISADADIFKNERILDSNWASKFPGSLWMSMLSITLSKKNIRVTTADVALSNVQHGFWDARTVGVIQHLDDPESELLITLGAKPILLLALESPLYADRFFNKLREIGEKFPNRIMLTGAYDICNFESGSNLPLRFPSYLQSDIQEITPWQDRKFMTVVTRNIYNLPTSSLFLKHPFDVIKWVRRRILLLAYGRNPNLSSFKYTQLIDRRLSAIIYFGRRKCLTLYGKGWESITNLPRFFQKQLLPIMKDLGGLPCIDKIQTIKNYKFVICFENAAYKGGLSEKIIDCFVAGAIPLYLGATDIEEFIPGNAFIDIRKFNSWDDLLQTLDQLSEIEALKIVQAGREFLNSADGNMHSYRGFCSLVEKTIFQHIK